MKKNNIQRLRISSQDLEKVKKALEKYNSSGLGKITQAELMRLGIMNFVNSILSATSIKLSLETGHC